MATISDVVQKAKLFFSLVAADADALAAVRKRLALDFSHVETESAVIAIDGFGADEEGRLSTGPKMRQWVGTYLPAFIPELVEIKRFTNKLEATFAEVSGPVVAIDPGYVTADKAVLTAVADAPHRLYINRGVYAEVVLGAATDECELAPNPWTPADYIAPAATEFFAAARARYHDFRRTHGGDS